MHTPDGSRPAPARARTPLPALAVLAACAVGYSPRAFARRDTPDAHGPARPAPAPPAPAPAATGDPGGIAVLLAAADDITHQVQNLRGLEPKRPIVRGVLSRDEIGKKLGERIAKEYTPEEIRVESRLLKRLGLLPPDVDYQGLLLGLLQEQVAGFYDPFARQLYIADWLGLDLQRPAMAHEIEHALQDQHFDLKAFATPLKDDGDRQLARSALVEGDGTAVMLEFVAQAHGFDPGNLPEGVIAAVGKQISSGAMDQSPLYTKAPRFLRETLLFPYFGGMQFVYAIRRGHTWARIDEVFRHPPESTEQVIHPEKYLAKERPVAITVAPLSSLPGRTELRRDVLGELELRVLFYTRLPDAEADAAAAGWGGDRLVVYGEAQGEGRPVVVVDLSTWDTEADAREAEAAMQKVVAFGAKAPTAPPAIYEQGGEASSVERRGRDVLAIFGAPASDRAALADEVWRTWKVAAHPPVEDKAPHKAAE